MMVRKNEITKLRSHDSCLRTFMPSYLHVFVPSYLLVLLSSCLLIFLSYCLRVFVPSCLLVFVTACGFEPVYATREQGGTTRDVLAQIRVVTPFGRPGDQLKADIEDRLNPEAVSTGSKYELRVQLNQRAEPFIIDTDGTASRFVVTFDSPFSLVNLADGKEVANGQVQRSTSYNVSETDDYSTVIAQNDAVRRGITELAEDYKLRLGGLVVMKKLAP